jgi:hemerythrin
MKTEDIIFECYKWRCTNIDQEIDFILVSEYNYIQIKREFLSQINSSFIEENQFMKRANIKLQGIDFSYHELIKGDAILIYGKNRR